MRKIIARRVNNFSLERIEKRRARPFQPSAPCINLLILVYVIVFLLCFLAKANFQNSHKEEHTAGAADELCNGESPPYGVYVACQREQIRRRNKNYKLSYYTYDKTVNALAESLAGAYA